MKLAFAAIIKPSDEEADLMAQLLANVSPHVDGLFITITGHNKKCEEVAKLFGAHISHYKWDKDFARARSFNFSQVPKEYDFILWGDADDQFRGLEKLRETMKQHPGIDVYLMDYLYWFDEWGNPTVVHTKEQIVRNDGCTEWQALFLHEGLAPKRIVEIKKIEGIERIHVSTEKRANEAKERNIDIALKAIKVFKNDPRAWWNLANSYKAFNEHDKAIESYEKFISMSRSDDEKYLARVRIAEAFWLAGDYSRAFDSVNYAIGLRTELPDAYHMKGGILFSMKRFQEARDCYQTGLVKVPNIEFNKLLVYNPREYDYVPLMNLAKTYINLSTPQLAIECIKACLKIIPQNKYLQEIVRMLEKESKKAEGAVNWLAKLRKTKGEKNFLKEYAKIPVGIRSHPMIVVERNTRVIKKESSGKDLVIYCGFTEELWNPETARVKGIGGSEEAVIHLSKGLVKRGWNVTVYNHCGYKEQVFDGVHYLPYWTWNYRDKQDVVILWRNPKIIQDVVINTDKLFLDLHDVVDEAELINRYEKLDRIFVKSKAQRELFPNVPQDKFTIIPNGVDCTLFNEKVERDPYLLVNFSSPDRSLEACIEVLEKVKGRVSKKIADKIRFAWYYGWGVFDMVITDSQGQEWKQSVIKRFEQMKKEGWAEGGTRINHQEVAHLNLMAGALIYPTNFYEIDYIGGSKAQIAGCVPITTDFAALDEKIQWGIKIKASKTRKNWQDVKFSFGLHDKKQQDKFVDSLVSYLKAPEKWDEERATMSKWARSEFNWDRIVGLWDDVLQGRS